MKIEKKIISENKPTVFIADIAANHDGNLNKAIDLIHSCAEVEQTLLNFNILRLKQ